MVEEQYQFFNLVTVFDRTLVSEWPHKTRLALKKNDFYSIKHQQSNGKSQQGVT